MIDIIPTWLQLILTLIIARVFILLAANLEQYLYISAGVKKNGSIAKVTSESNNKVNMEDTRAIQKYLNNKKESCALILLTIVGSALSDLAAVINDESITWICMILATLLSFIISRRLMDIYFKVDNDDTSERNISKKKNYRYLYNLSLFSKLLFIDVFILALMGASWYLPLVTCVIFIIIELTTINISKNNKSFVKSLSYTLANVALCVYISKNQLGYLYVAAIIAVALGTLVHDANTILKMIFSRQYRNENIHLACSITIMALGLILIALAYEHYDSLSQIIHNAFSDIGVYIRKLM